MAAPPITGQSSLSGSQPGFIQLGGQVTAAAAKPGLALTTKPYIAHLYANDWSFKALLGPIRNRPILHFAINGGHQETIVDLPTRNGVATQGDIVTLTEQGGDGRVVFSGTVEDMPDDIAVGKTIHNITLAPLVNEIGDAFLNKDYATPTDVAQMVRDLVAQTNHLKYTWNSIPDTGIPAMYNFANASGVEVMSVARLIAGLNYFWFVDAQGIVWFQATGATPSYSVTRGIHYNRRLSSASIKDLRNYVLVIGDIDRIPGGTTATPAYSAPLTSLYSNLTSQHSYGLRAMPPVHFPTAKDQATLDAISATIGAVYDRVVHHGQVDLPNFGTRIEIGRPGGGVIRYLETPTNSLRESETGTGYSSNFVVLDVTVDGPKQTVVFGDVVATGLSDLQAELDRIITRHVNNVLNHPPALLNVHSAFGVGGSLASGPA